MVTENVRAYSRIFMRWKYVIVPVALVSLVYFAYISWDARKTKFLTPDEIKAKCKNHKINRIAEKWIIVTSINSPTSDLKKLATIDGWQLLVVGDRKTPKNWSMPGAHFLSIEDQYAMNYEILKSLPEKTYTRKMTGYLYAIQHGAKFIYETDDDNSPWPKLDFSSFFEGPEVIAMVVDAPAGAYNPLPHFGQSSMWPRGYPLDKIGAPQPRSYYKYKMKTPPIQQGVVNGDPDVDALYRLTRKHVGHRINVTFDRNAPAVVLPEGALTSYNCQNTLFHYDAFWSFFLPPSRTFRVLDIWRAYWAQRLMWLVGQRLMYIPPSAFQFRSPHDFMDDFEQEKQLYDDTGKLVEFLVNWQCTKSNFYDCISELSFAMAEENFWAVSDAKLVQAWLTDLQNICYVPPVLYTGPKEDLKSNERIEFYPVEQGSSVPNNGENIVLPPMREK